MVEKFGYNDNLKRHDLELVLEANRKAIELQAEIAEQNEEFFKILDSIKDTLEDQDNKLDKIIETQDSKLDKITTSTNDLSKDLFRIQVLFITGLLSLVIQVFQIFIKH